MCHYHVFNRLNIESMYCISKRTVFTSGHGSSAGCTVLGFRDTEVLDLDPLWGMNLISYIRRCSVNCRGFAMVIFSIEVIVPLFFNKNLENR
jgi:hypothetical protein